MADDRREFQSEDDFGLEDILEEVSGWLEQDARNEAPLPDVLLDLMPASLERPEVDTKDKVAPPAPTEKPAQKQPPREKVPQSPEKSATRQKTSTETHGRETQVKGSGGEMPPQTSPTTTKAPEVIIQPVPEVWSGRPDASAFGAPMIPSQAVRLPTPKAMRQPAIRLPIDKGEDGAEETAVSPESTLQAEKGIAAESVPQKAPEQQNGEGETAGPIPNATAPSLPGEKTQGEGANDQMAAESDVPDNIITLYPQKEPETIREAVSQAAQQAKEWARENKENFTPPKVHVKRPKIPKIPGLPDLPPPPDTDPKILVKEFGEGLSRLRTLMGGAFLCVLVLLILTLFQEIPVLPFPNILAQGEVMGWLGLGLFALTCLLSAPVLRAGLIRLLKGKPSMETVALLAAITVTADALTLLLMQLRPYSMPHYLPAMTVLAFQMLGTYLKRKQQRVASRTAAQSRHPDRLHVEPQSFGGKAAYRRRSGTAAGFGSQIQQEDGAEKIFRYYVPLSVLLTVGLSILATTAKGNSELICWAVSGGLIAAATLGGCLCFSLPNRELSQRLARDGVALAGWVGIRTAKPGAVLLVEDTDLFPPGSVKITSARSFGSFSQEKVFSVTASIIRATGSGLDEVFEGLMRMEGGTLVTVSDLEQHKDGISARALGQAVLVGNSNFLERMGVALPPGVRVRTGVFTAIGGSFAGQFVLSYSLHKSAMPAVDGLLLNRITPVLAALDFNISPPLLRKLFRFPWDRLSFPELEQRRKLLAAQPHSGSSLLAILGVEGLAPIATAATGAQRLRRALKLCLRFTLLGSLVGIGLVFYLAQAAALTALSPLHLTIFLLLWGLPLLLISGWVNQF